MVPISAGQWPNCTQHASLFMHGHGRAAFPFLLLILLSVIPNSGPPMPYFWRYKRPSILITAPVPNRPSRLRGRTAPRKKEENHRTIFPSLISLMVYVDVKHHVYFTYFPAPLALTEILRTCTLSVVALSSLQVSLQVSKSVSKSPSQSPSQSPSFSLIRATSVFNRLVWLSFTFLVPDWCFTVVWLL